MLTISNSASTLQGHDNNTRFGHLTPVSDQQLLTVLQTFHAQAANAFAPKTQEAWTHDSKVFVR